jgi:hypothetical protein
MLAQQKAAAAKTRQWEVAQNKMQLDQIGLGKEDYETDEKSQGGTGGSLEIHPSTIGFYMKRSPARFDASVISPLYFGCQSMRIDKGVSSSASSSAAALSLGRDYTTHYPKLTLREIGSKLSASIASIPCPPIVSGQVRQRYKLFGDNYDEGKILHPAVYGHFIISKGYNPTLMHPSFFGYNLHRKHRIVTNTTSGLDRRKSQVEERKECKSVSI